MVSILSPTPARSSPKSLPMTPVLPRSLPKYPIYKTREHYDDTLPGYKHLYAVKSQIPSYSPPLTTVPIIPIKKAKARSVGGVNLTPLISALLLAGIKLALEQKKKAKAAKSAKAATSKSTKSAKSAKAAKATKPLKRQRKTI